MTIQGRGGRAGTNLMESQEEKDARRFRAAYSTPLAGLSADDEVLDLYHYTSADGALGIISSGEIWASDASFVNDASEMQYGVALLDEVWKALSTEEKLPDEIDHFIGTVVDILKEDWEALYRVYIICFCNNGNLLSQWRAYGNVGAGFALGFESANLMARAREFDFSLKRVEYVRDVQRKNLREYFERLLRSQYLTEEFLRDRQHLNPLFQAIEPELLHFVVSFKDFAFHEEHEWRLVLVRPVSHSTDVRFRVIKGRIVPYVPLNLGDGAESVPLVNVTVGPSPERSVNERSIKELLKQYSLSNVEVRSSGVPYRA